MRFVLALMLGMGLLSTASAQTCSKQTITGTYGLLCTPVGVIAPIAIVGNVTGGQNTGVQANFLGTGKINLAGSVQNVTFNGTAALNPDCSGTMSMALGFSMPTTITLAFHVLDGGNEIRGITTDPSPFIYTCSLRLITR